MSLRGKWAWSPPDNATPSNFPSPKSWVSDLSFEVSFVSVLKYSGPILCVTSPALGSYDLSLDQSGTSIQILPEPNTVNVCYKITTLS